MSTSKIFDKIAILLICLALIFSLAIALTWTAVDSTSVMTVNENDLAKITEYIDLDDKSGEVPIITGGTYYISGTLEDGSIYVDIDDTEYAILILAGAEIYCSDGSAIDVENSGNCAIYLAEGTENIVSSGTECEINKNSADEDASGGAVLFKDNATICGEGSLTVYGYINNGIHCSNDLFIESGNITVTAVNNGIKGKDNLVVDGGNISIVAGNAGLKSGESGDSDSGNIVINGGVIDIGQSVEGMEANQITINDGQTSIVASDDGINACGGSNMIGGGAGDTGGQMGGQMGGGSQSKGDKGGHGKSDSTSTSDGAVQPPEIPEGTSDGAVQPPEIPEGTSEGAVQPPEKPDDSEFGAMQQGDGSQPPEIPEGTSDGAMNSKNMPEAMDFEDFEFGSMEESDSDEDSNVPSLTINGGYLYVLAGGDGLDSNGDLIINGGTVIVDGPADSANGALDSGSENGGQLLVNGGTLIAVGASGMAEVPEDASEQNVINFNASFSAGDEIAISDSNGNVIFKYNAAKSGNSIIFSSVELEIGETYNISIDDMVYELELTDTVTSGSSGDANQGMDSFGPGNMGDFDSSQMDDFDPSEVDDFDPSQMGDFDPSQMGDGEDPPEKPSGEMGGGSGGMRGGKPGNEGQLQ